MTEESEEMLLLLQELATIKEADEEGLEGASLRRKLRKEINQEMKRLAQEKKARSQG